MIKDKLKIPKVYGYDITIKPSNPSDLIQCPKCYQLLKLTKEGHKCYDFWNGCTICHLSLEKNPKERVFMGHKWTSLGLKKHFRVINSLICYNCACNIARMLKKE